MSEEEKVSIREYIFVAISFIVMGIILLIVGAYIFPENLSTESFWDITVGLISSNLDLAGIVSIVFLPILSLYTVRKRKKEKISISLSEYISSIAIVTIGFIIMGTILIIIGHILMGWGGPLGIGRSLGFISWIMGDGTSLIGYGCITFSPIISWYNCS